MSDERPTPPHLPPSRYLLDEMRVQVGAMSDRVGRIRTQQIEAFGADGHGGFVGRLREDSKTCEGRVSDMTKRIEQLELEARGLRTKLGLVVAGASMLAGTAVSVIARLLGG